MKYLFIITFLFIFSVSKAQYEKDTMFRDTVLCFISTYDYRQDKDSFFLAYKLYWTYIAYNTPMYVISYRTKDSTGKYSYFNPIRMVMSIDLEKPKHYSQLDKSYRPDRIH